MWMQAIETVGRRLHLICVAFLFLVAIFDQPSQSPATFRDLTNDVPREILIAMASGLLALVVPLTRAKRYLPVRVAALVVLLPSVTLVSLYAGFGMLYLVISNLLS